MFGLTASDLLSLGVAIDVSDDEVLAAPEHLGQPAFTSPPDAQELSERAVRRLMIG